MRTTFLSLTFFFLSTTYSQAFQSQYSSETGDIYLIESTQSMTQSLMMMGQSMDIESKTNVSESLEVISEKDGVLNIKLTNNSIRSEVHSPMTGTQIIDSSDPSSGDGVLSKLVGVYYTFSMNKYGEIMEIEIPDELTGVLEEIATKNPEYATVLSLFGEEAIRASLTMRFSIYSSDGLEEWEVNQEMEVAGMPMQMMTTHSNKNGKAETESDIVIKTTTEQMGMQVELDMSGNQSMKFELDKNSGMPLTITGESEMDGSVMTMGNSMPMTIINTQTTTISKQ